MGRSLGEYRTVAAAHCRGLGRYPSGGAATHHRTQTRADGHAAQRGVGVLSHRTDARDYRGSVSLHYLGTATFKKKNAIRWMSWRKKPGLTTRTRCNDARYGQTDIPFGPVDDDRLAQSSNLEPG